MFISQMIPSLLGQAVEPVTAGDGFVNRAFAEWLPIGAPAWMLWLEFAGILFLPMLLSWLIAKGMGMTQEHRTRTTWILLALFIAVTPFTHRMIMGENPGDAFRLGVDLAGGANLVFEIDIEKAKEKKKLKPDADDKEIINDEEFEQMLAAIRRRVNPSGTEEVTVRRVGPYRFEVIVPDVTIDDIEVIKDRIRRLGSLEFAILAKPGTAHDNLITDARNLGENDDNLIIEKKLVAGWRNLARTPGGQPKDVERREAVTREVTRTIERNGIPITEKITQFLCIFEEEDMRVTGDYLRRVSPGQEGTQLSVDFQFNQQGGYLFGVLTDKYKPSPDGLAKYRLSILLDEEVHSAPSINAVITTRGQITGGFTQDEINELVNTLTSGRLQYPLKDDVRTNIVDPTLGAEVREMGAIAIMIAGFVVVGFMAFYYRGAGLIADLCLALNIFLVLGIMCFVQATFTLPGLAGIVLTIGMAVDANVLIFERIREERVRGSSLRMSIQNGFDKAFTTIIDANLTTLITAVVLYIIGTDQVKGFAVTLFIGIVMSMFSALYFGRLMFEVLERKRWLKDLRFHAIVKEGGTNWNFIGKRRTAGVISAIVISVGIVSLIARGRDNLDIDFTGGARVSFEFVEDQDLENVREKINATFTKNPASVERLSQVGGGSDETRFRLLTRITDINEIKAKVNEAFKDPAMELRKVHLVKGEIKPADDKRTSAIVDFTTPDAEGKTAAKAVPIPTARSYFVAALTGDYDSDLNIGEKEAVAAMIELVGKEGPGLTAGKVRTRMYNQYEVLFSEQIKLEDATKAIALVQTKLDNDPYFFEEDTFGTAVGGEMKQTAIMAMLVSLVAIVGYIWFRFNAITFGLAAVVALVHDVLVVVGMVAAASLISGNPVSDLFLLSDFKINLPMVAAFLTIVGYSLNDTIVVFDRIREVRGKNPAMTEDIINRSLNQTLSRTLLTSITTMLVVLILYIVGGGGIHGFAFCLVLGILVGTYSSIYIASPVLLWLMNRPAAIRARGPAAARTTT